ncbi:MAG: LPS translocon maturation chaperone LptM [Burkholderiales bacterium]
MRSLVLSLLLTTFLAACGMKGPLYLPPPEQPNKTDKK